MTTYVNIKLTGPQAEALNAAAAYCLSGGPEDWGQTDDAEGRRAQRNLARAQESLIEAIDTPRRFETLQQIHREG